MDTIKNKVMEDCFEMSFNSLNSESDEPDCTLKRLGCV